jgi:hypothetical protein
MPPSKASHLAIAAWHCGVALGGWRGVPQCWPSDSRALLAYNSALDRALVIARRGTWL